MRKLNLFACMLLLLTSTIFAQVGIGTTTPAASSALDITATNKGLLIPSVALTGSLDTVTITSPATSLLVYNNATAGTSPNNVTPGYYYYTGTQWERLTNGGANSVGAISTSSNANGASITAGVLQLAPASVDYGGVVTNSTQTIAGTKTFSVDAIVNGLTVGKGTNSGLTNSAFGYRALFSNNNSNSTNNSAFGFQALKDLTSGTNNNAFGSGALQKTTSGTQNIAIGTNSLNSNVLGNFNIGIGHGSLFATLGTGSILSPTTGGSANVAIGSGALSANTTGTFNTALGFSSGGTNEGGYKNTVIGANTGFSATNLNNATAIGFGATATASNSIQLGNADVTNVNTSGTITAGTVNTNSITYPNTNGAVGQVLSISSLTSNNATASWVTPSVGSVNGILPIANGGTGASTQNFVDLTTNQTIGGTKTFNVDATINGLTVGKGNGNNDTNTALGNGSLAAVTPNLPTALDGINNTAVGRSALAANTTGNGNIAVGSSALTANTSGLFNIAIGVDALRTYNVLGGGHIAIGYQALSNSVAGYENTAVGNQSQLYNVGTVANTGVQNTSVGAQSLKANVSGRMNTAIGANAANGTIGDYNTAIGGESLKNNPDQVIYNNNTAIGYNAASRLSGSLNTAIGAESLKASSGTNNVAIGYQALSVSADGSANNGSNNTIIGHQAQLNANATATTWTGSNNTVIGAGARVNNTQTINSVTTTINNSTAIGYQAIATASNTIQFGNASITDVFFGSATTTFASTATAVGVAGTGASVRARAFYTNSDARIKKDIVNSKYGLATILKLRPVDYHLINDVKQEPQVGFIAQEVKAVVPELVTGKEGDLAKGEILGVNYAGLAPILTKAIQELKKENELQQIEINQLKELVKNLISKK